MAALNQTPAPITPTGTLTGTPASPTSIAAAGSATATFVVRTLNSAGPALSAEVVVRLLTANPAPTTSPSVQFQFSFDGTTFFNDGGPWNPTVGTSASYDAPPYEVPPVAVAARVTVTNGATNAITAFAQCNQNTSS